MGILDEIKKDSLKTGSKVQTSESAKLEKILNKLFYLPKNIHEETRFVVQVMTRGQETQERIGLHASSLIVPDDKFCIRQQVLSLLFKQLQGEQLPVKTMRIFEEGNAIHEKWQRLFIRGGYAIPETLDRTRIDEEYKVSYTPDIVCRIPEYFPGAMIGEVKSVNPIIFKKMINHPSAFKQLQSYMFLCIKEKQRKGTWNCIDYTKGFVLCEDKATQDIKLFVYDYNYDAVKQFEERCKLVQEYYEQFIGDGKMVGRPRSCDSYFCKMAETCPMKDACWNKGMGRVRI